MAVHGPDGKEMLASSTLNISATDPILDPKMGQLNRVI